MVYPFVLSAKLVFGIPVFYGYVDCHNQHIEFEASSLTMAVRVIEQACGLQNAWLDGS